MATKQQQTWLKEMVQHWTDKGYTVEVGDDVFGDDGSVRIHLSNPYGAVQVMDIISRIDPRPGVPNNHAALFWNPTTEKITAVLKRRGCNHPEIDGHRFIGYANRDTRSDTIRRLVKSSLEYITEEDVYHD